MEDSWFWTLVIGGFAGWLAGKIMKGDGYGFIVNILLGIAGGWVGGKVFGLLDLNFNGKIGYLITALVGAVVLVWIGNKLKKK